MTGTRTKRQTPRCAKRWHEKQETYAYSKLEGEKEKNKQQQKDYRKLKLEIGKLKVIIKGEEDDNNEMIEEVTKLQRDIGIARKEIEMMEIKTKALQSIQMEKQSIILRDS